MAKPKSAPKAKPKTKAKVKAKKAAVSAHRSALNQRFETQRVEAQKRMASADHAAAAKAGILPVALATAYLDWRKMGSNRERSRFGEGMEWVFNKAGNYFFRAVPGRVLVVHLDGNVQLSDRMP